MVVVTGHRDGNSSQATRLERYDLLNEDQTKRHIFKEVGKNELCSPGKDMEILKSSCILKMKVTLVARVVTGPYPGRDRGRPAPHPPPQDGGGHKEDCFMSCACSKAWLHEVNRHE